MPGKKNKSDIALYLQIRRYVVGLALSGERKQRLPTFDKLMEIFHVSRPTVSKAIKGLLEEGVVISKNGIGLFAVLGNRDDAKIAKPQVVGCIVGDGRHFGMYSSHARHCGQLMFHVTEYNLWMRCLNLASGNSPEEIVQELERERLDAVVLLESADVVQSPVIEALAILKQRGLKVVTGESVRPEFTSVSMKYISSGRLIGQELLKRNEKTVFFFPNRGAWTVELDGIREAYSEAGRPLDERYCFKCLGDDETIVQTLAKAVHENPDLHFVCIKGIPSFDLEKQLAELAPDVLEKCTFIDEKGDFAVLNSRMKVLEIKCPEEQYVRAILQEVRRQLDGDDTIRRITMPEDAFQISSRE